MHWSRPFVHGNYETELRGRKEEKLLSYTHTHSQSRELKEGSANLLANNRWCWIVDDSSSTDLAQ
jgi:hypothetical protein